MLLLLLLSLVSCVRLCRTPQTAAHQAPLSLGFSRQEYWSGFPFPSPMHACMLSHFSRVQLCVTFTSRIWNSSTGIPSPPLALFVVMVSNNLHIIRASYFSSCSDTNVLIDVSAIHSKLTTKTIQDQRTQHFKFTDIDFVHFTDRNNI